MDWIAPRGNDVDQERGRRSCDVGGRYAVRPRLKQPSGGPDAGGAKRGPALRDARSRRMGANKHGQGFFRRLPCSPCTFAGPAQAAGEPRVERQAAIHAEGRGAATKRRAAWRKSVEARVGEIRMMGTPQAASSVVRCTSATLVGAAEGARKGKGIGAEAAQPSESV